MVVSETDSAIRMVRHEPESLKHSHHSVPEGTAQSYPGAWKPEQLETGTAPSWLPRPPSRLRPGLRLRRSVFPERPGVRHFATPLGACIEAGESLHWGHRADPRPRLDMGVHHDDVVHNRQQANRP